MPGSVSSVVVDTGGPGYSQLVGFIYVFNLIVGTGALTMPAAFTDAGWLVSMIVVVLLAFTSYLTVTFIIETMAAANAVLKHKASLTMRKTTLSSTYMGQTVDVETRPLETRPLVSESETRPFASGPRPRSYTNPALDPKTVDDLAAPVVEGPGGGEGPAEISESVDPRAPPGVMSLNRSADMVRPENLFLTELFEITDKVELGEMAKLFFSKAGLYAFYLCIIVYLYGDLAVYAAAVPKSLRDIICMYRPGNGSECSNETVADEDYCFSSSDLTRLDVYRIAVAGFGLLLGPFTFFNVQKTKYLQMFTTVMRWLAFLTMITLTTIRLAQGEGRGTPPVADLSGVPTLFGVCVYSFMCHHSLPSLVTPIGDKSKIHTLFAADYMLILGFYCLLSFTGIFTFQNVQDLYTLNFEPDPCSTCSNPITNIVFIQYFLALFPVFTLSTSFPIIAITLRNNLIALFKRENPYPFWIRKVGFPLLAVLPPLAVAIGTSNLGILVGITGSYAGAGIQYVVPAFLVFCSRKQTFSLFENNIKNTHTSPFRHAAWIAIVLVWAVACVILVTVNHIVTKS